jgi:hypothetical protein
LPAVAAAGTAQVLDPSILIKGYLLVKPEDKLGKLAKRAKKLRKKITKTAFKMMGDDDRWVRLSRLGSIRAGTGRVRCVTQRALSVTQRALSVTRRALSVTQRALSVTQRAL